MNRIGSITVNNGQKYWDEKVEAVVKVSREYGYSEQNHAFWNQQPVEIILLILDITADCEHKEVLAVAHGWCCKECNQYLQPA